MVFCISFLTPFVASAYQPRTTHAGLTEQMIEFYNSSNSKPIGTPDMELIVQASVDEDFLTRPLNHFYDPIRNIGINNARSSKVWAIDGSIVENDYSWPKAIRAYAEGKDRQALIGLGHILHLIEDLSVPDHTRNDPHKGDGLENGFTGESPYEKWTNDTKNRETLKGLARWYLVDGSKAYHFNDLAQAFDFLAGYSNYNFFSRDTIVNKIYQYSNPLLNDGDGLYLYSFDSINKDRHKLLKINRDKVTGKIEYVLVTDNDKSVLSSYFDRLAKQAILTGVGVIELFFREGEKARAEYKIEQVKAEQEKIAKDEAIAKAQADKSYLGKVVASIGTTFSNYITEPIVNTSRQLATTVSGGATGISQASGHYSAFLFSSSALAVQEGKEAVVVEANKVKATIALATAQVATIIRQTINQNIDTSSQVASASEIVSPPAKNIALATPTSEIKSVTIPTPPIVEKVIKEISTIIPSFFYNGGGGGGSSQTARVIQPEVVIEDTATSTATTSTPTLPASSLLSFNVTECSHSLVVGICAVATSTIRLSWQASTTPDYFQVAMSGTQDEIATTTENQAEVLLSGAGTYTFLVEAYASTTSSTAYASSTQTVVVLENPVVINEIAWSGTSATTTDQWLELYNNSTYSIDLSALKITSLDSNFSINLGGVISSHGYALLERGSDQVVQNISADMVYEVIETSLLPDTGTALSLLWSDTIIDQIPDSTFFGWTAGNENVSMERFSTTVSGKDADNWSSNLVYVSTGNDSLDSPIFGTPRQKNSISYLINKGQIIESPVTLTIEDSPYIIEGDYDMSVIASTGSLVVDPGVVIKVYNSYPVYSNGQLNIHGTVSNPVIFTSVLDTSVGAGIPIRTEQVVGGNTFAGITLYDGSEGSVINNLQIKSVKKGITFNKTNAKVDGLSISNSDNGITIKDGYITLNNIQLENIQEDAISVYGGEMIISSSTISGVYDGDAIALYTASSSITGVSISGLDDGDAFGLYDSFATLDNVSTLDSMGGSALGMYSSFATTTRSVFKNGLFGIELYSSALHISTSTVSGFERTGISGYSSNLVISGVTVSSNATGIDAYGDFMSIDYSNIFGNTDYGLYYAGSGILQVMHSWWGDMTGPYHETDNPAGLGNGVYGSADFSGWLLEAI